MSNLATKDFFAQDSVKNKFKELMGKRSAQFITSVLQVVSQNDLLSKADPISVFNAAATAATLNLPINQNLGFAYIVPYKGKAQFQMGYKGFIQLAQRSGLFQKISDAPIYKGQLKSENPLSGYEFDFTVRPDGQPIGYAAYFKLMNGFEATLYMTMEDVQRHAKRYSKTFSSGPWQTDFDAMARKTVLKLLLTKYAPLSIEMQQAIKVDQAIINDSDGNNVTYIDNEAETIDPVKDRLIRMIEAAESVDVLMNLELEVNALGDAEVTELYKSKSLQF